LVVKGFFTSRDWPIKPRRTDSKAAMAPETYRLGYIVRQRRADNVAVSVARRLRRLGAASSDGVPPILLVLHPACMAKDTVVLTALL
jgi:hypothetical protein